MLPHYDKISWLVHEMFLVALDMASHWQIFPLWNYIKYYENIECNNIFSCFRDKWIWKVGLNFRVLKKSFMWFCRFNKQCNPQWPIHMIKNKCSNDLNICLNLVLIIANKYCLKISNLIKSIWIIVVNVKAAWCLYGVCSLRA